MHLRIQKTIHPILKKKKEIAVELFGGKCFFCPKKYGKYFSFHHLNYDPTRKTYKDFNNNTVKYHVYLIPEILANPQRFLLVCRGHHDLLEWAVSIKNPEFWGRFFLGIMCTDSSRGESLPESSITRICLENNRVIAYHLNNNSALKTYLARHVNIASMFGETNFEPQ